MSEQARYSAVTLSVLLMVAVSCVDGQSCVTTGTCPGGESAVKERDSATIQGQPAGSALEAASLELTPALFVENQGQWADCSIRYVHDGDRVDVAMKDSGIVFRVDARPLQFSASFVGAKTVCPVGVKRSDSTFNYCVGDRSGWRTGVASYEKLVYPGLYEGVDLHVRGLRSRLKYEFHVAPGADYRRIAVRYDGIEGLAVREDGSLAVDLGRDGGVIRDDAPSVYQEIDGRKVELPGRFIICGERTYSFDVTGDIRPDHPLVIDPNLAWSSYLGGAKGDFATDVAADDAGNVYVVGWTESPGWAVGGFDTKYEGNYGDAFVSKLSSTGAHVWSTYLGGTMGDSARGVTVDARGNVYVVGSTTSPAWVSGGYDRAFDGNEDDGFIVVLTSAGVHVWSSYIGGVSRDVAEDVAVDAAGNVYVAGVTKSPGWTVGGPDTSFNGDEDVFLIKLNKTGSHLWSTYLGGTKKEYDGFVAVGDANNVYVAGTTESSGWITGGSDTTLGGTSDAFVVKLSEAGKQLWATYVGGTAIELGAGVAVDSTGAVYVGGSTTSAGWVHGGYDTILDAPESDGFIVKLSAAGGPVWSTYVGGADRESADDICVDDGNNVYIVGDIIVDKGIQPSAWISGGPDTTYNGGYDDGFIVKLTSGGAHVWSSFVGGPGDEGNAGVAVNPAGDVFVVGGTGSPSWTVGGFDTSLNGGDDAFVVKISESGGTHNGGNNGGNHDEPPRPGQSPLYRFWSPVYSRHFYTVSEDEKKNLIDNSTDVWTYEGVAYYVPSDANSVGSLPVYRFRLVEAVAYFYTITESEKDMLIRDFPTVWTFENVAFRAYPEGAQPAGTAPVYRFWSGSSACHFYTISEAEREMLIRDFPTVWTFEGIAWYAYPK